MARNTTTHSPVFIFMLLKEFLHLFLLEFSLVLIVASNGTHFVYSVLLLSKELLEGEHHVTLGGGARRFPGHAGSHWNSMDVFNGAIIVPTLGPLEGVVVQVGA